MERSGEDSNSILGNSTGSFPRPCRMTGNPEVMPPGLVPRNVSALSEARFQEKRHGSTVLRRAFDKAVRRKRPLGAADAGRMQIHLREGAGSRCPQAGQQGTPT